jgi:hypothetical protein
MRCQNPTDVDTLWGVKKNPTDKICNRLYSLVMAIAPLLSTIAPFPKQDTHDRLFPHTAIALCLWPFQS